jgi:hypothetical protein
MSRPFFEPNQPIAQLPVSLPAESVQISEDKKRELSSQVVQILDECVRLERSLIKGSDARDVNIQFSYLIKKKKTHSQKKNHLYRRF